MQEKWKKFWFRTIVSCVGALYSYMSSVDVETFAWKMAAWLIVQALLSALASAPVEVEKTGAKVSGWKRLLSYL